MRDFIWAFKVFRSRWTAYARYAIHAPFVFKNWFQMLLVNRSACPVLLRLRNGLQFEVRPNTTDRATVNENFIGAPYDGEPGFQLDVNDTVVDIGGNIGAFSVFAGNKARNGRLVCVEPIAGNFAQLSKNLKLNGLDRAVPINAAIGGSDGEVELSVAGAASSAHWSNDNARREKIRQICLKTLCAEQNLARVDFLKMDCEGAEFEALMQAPPEIVRRFRRIAMEYHNLSPEKHVNVLRTFLEQQGYSVRISEGDWNGTLFAIRKD